MEDNDKVEEASKEPLGVNMIEELNVAAEVACSSMGPEI
jgi:hypothetical protein